jgi:hypothetical protein
MNVALHIPQLDNDDLNDLPVFISKGYELKPFDEKTISFFDTLSKAILANAEINRMPEIAALAFWLRRSNLKKIRSENASLFDASHFILAPLGKVFHVCPANVDTMFIYSMAVSLLMGNKNLLRISTRMEAPHIMQLLAMMNVLFQKEEFSVLKNYINIISYPHDAVISNYISTQSNARVIWGGDATIERFREFRSGARTKDIIFADRISVLCIQCEAFNQLDETERLKFAKQFFNDAYTFDQKGCSSPQTIFLLGPTEAYEQCVAGMTELLSSFVEEHYQTDVASIASLKLNQLVDDTIDQVISHRHGDNLVTFVDMKEASHESLHHSCGAGYFYTKHLATLEEMKPFVNSKLQTVSYFGLTQAEMEELKELSMGEGIDRIVPLGSALDFYYIWDGYNLLEELSRKVYIK